MLRMMKTRAFFICARIAAVIPPACGFRQNDSY
jgi:hypothetical protein